MQKARDPYLSPLRYPGGKAILGTFFQDVLAKNNIHGTFCEAYAGGAGAALDLLFSNSVNHIILNDADYHIYAFWSSILNNADEFVNLIKRSRISVTGWYRQRDIYDNPTNHSIFEVGFATFYLNRCNRGGILPNAGPIGGYDQTGNYLIDARFDKNILIERIKKIASKRDRIQIHNLDAVDFLHDIVSELNPQQTLVYLDPPYFTQGQNLYLNFYGEGDHQLIQLFLSEIVELKWVVSYDNVPEINHIYSDYRKFPFNINYSAHVSRQGKELLVFSDSLELPEHFTMRKASQKLICT